MWRRAYLFLILVRLYFALSPSYLHPDENFQGPEVIAGEIFNYPVKRTWEFTSDNPIRSVFPLWPAYGLPMLLLRWIWIGNGRDGEVAPVVVFWTLRVLMFLLSFVLEDWAVHDLVQSPRHRRVAVLLVASSYVTWTYQTHTFSNSLETLLVAWSLVLIQRITDDKQRSSPFASAILASLLVLGVFNRITFPAFIIVPGFHLIPHLLRKPKSLFIMSSSGLITLFTAIVLDTEFYNQGPVSWYLLFTRPVITPFNNFVYNISAGNLALHGLHPWYQHFLANLPQLLGPAMVLLILQPILALRLYSAISGIIFLSFFKHQEARFLIPAIPLILSSIQLPRRQRHLRIWVALWVVFNAFFGVLMGIYHQGAIISAQVFLSHQGDATQAVWWKTYSPPIWLLDGKNEYLSTHDVMGMNKELMIEELESLATCPTTDGKNGTYLIAPLSATYLDAYVLHQNPKHLQLEEVWRNRQHLNLDDLDFGDDGILPTLQRVVGRRGLGIWRVTKSCLP